MAPKRKRYDYPLENLHEAWLKVTTEGESIRNAARECGVPYSTLCDRVSGKVPIEKLSTGDGPLFTYEEERRLAKHILQMADWGYGYTRTEVCMTAAQYANDLNKDRDHSKIMSLGWYRKFLGRQKDLLKVYS